MYSDNNLNNVWEDMDQNFNNEKLFEREDIPDANYPVNIEKAELTYSKSKLPMVSIGFRIADYVTYWGNKVIYWNQVLTNRKQLDRVMFMINSILKPFEKTHEFKSYKELGEELSGLAELTKDRAYLLEVMTTKRGYKVFRIEQWLTIIKMYQKI